MQRRELLKAALLAPPVFLAGPALGRAKTAREVYAYAGCYTTEQRHARGDGIHVYRMDGNSGAWSHIQHLGELVNPSFLITSRDGRFLYSAHGDERYATAFSVDPATGRIAVLNRGDTGGVNGAHAALSPDGGFLLVANYGSGTVAVLPVHPNGSLGGHVQLVPLEGAPGPHRVEQPGSRPHQVVFDPSGHFALVPDKGLDRVFVFRFEKKDGRLTPAEQGSVKMRSGSGPRHLAFHPGRPVVWLLSELNNSITTCAWEAEKGTLKPIQVLPSLPPDFAGDSTAAEIAVAPGGRFVFCSNRGHDSIAAFRAHPETGLLTSIGWTPAGGKTPRFIGFDPGGSFLYSANEQGDAITAFRLQAATGKLLPLGRPTENRSPVTITFTQF